MGLPLLDIKIDKAAIARLVEQINLIDTGRAKVMNSLWLPDVLREITPSEKRFALGAELLEASLPLFANEAVLERDWKKRKEFETPWGRGVALKTTASNLDGYAYARGFVLVIQIEPERGWHTFRGLAGSEVDLTPVYEELLKVDAKASWFLHHAKQMLLNGSRSAPNVVPSRLSTDRLIEIVHKVAR